MGNRGTNAILIILIAVIIVIGGIYYNKVLGGYNEITDYIEQNKNQSITSNVVKDEETNVQVTNRVVEKQSTTSVPAIVIPVPPAMSKDNDTQEENNIEASTYEYNNKYYYNQLDPYAKVLYDVIEKNIGNLTSGNYVININYDFNKLLDQENGQEQIENYYDDAINALNLDIPNLFFLDFSKMFLNIEATTSVFKTTYKLYLDAGTNNNYFLDSFNSKTQVETAKAQMDKMIEEVANRASGNEYEKLKITHDWMLDFLEYNGESINKGTIYGALAERKAVCEGYARTYKSILDKLGITNILVTGTATNSSGVTEDHMWNYVYINGNWYAVDVTWDDPIVYGGGTLNYWTKHEYFLIGKSKISKNHTEKGEISSTGKKFILPTLSDKNY